MSSRKHNSLIVAGITEDVTALPDILAFLQMETELTRHTLAQILKRSGRLADFRINPHAFMVAVVREISHALHDLMLEGIKEKVAGAYWEQSRIEQEAEKGNHPPLLEQSLRSPEQRKIAFRRNCV